MNGTWRGRPDPTPPSRELVGCFLLAGLAVLAFAPLAAQGIVVFARSGHFAWPTDPVAALFGIVRGEYGVGLPPRDARTLPADWALTVLSVLAMVVALAGQVLLARFALGQGAAGHGAVGSRTGLGTVREARLALGAAALRRRAGAIRPDLRRPGLRGSRGGSW
jgi:type IV secretion system protein VirD4